MEQNLHLVPVKKIITPKSSYNWLIIDNYLYIYSAIFKVTSCI